MTGKQEKGRREYTEAPVFRPLYEYMKHADPGNVREHFEAYLRSVRAIDRVIPVDGRYVYTEVLMTAYRIVREARHVPEKGKDAPWKGWENFCPGDLESVIPVGTEILSRALRIRDEGSRTRGGTAIRKAVSYLERHYTDPELTFQEVVEHVSLSPSHFSTLFARTTGQTFTGYLIGLRLQKARELLRTTDMRSSEIAFAVGFSDPHYFSHLFRKKTGVTPVAFRFAPVEKG